jgi:hypothetical protein
MNAPRSERCACRGWIDVEDEHDEAEVMTAVALHNSKPVHRAWREAAPPIEPQPRLRVLRDLMTCPGLDGTGCGSRIRRDQSLCYGCARTIAVGRRSA